MKLISTISLLALLTVSTASFAQRGMKGGPELGIRLEGGYSNTFSIDGVLPLSKYPRLHGDLMLGDGYFGLVGIVDFIYPFQGVDGLFFYIGPGGGLGFYSWKEYNATTHKDETKSGISASIVAEAGIEYRFPIELPISVGFDIRPSIMLIPHVDTYANAGLNIRYRF